MAEEPTQHPAQDKQQQPESHSGEDDSELAAAAKAAALHEPSEVAELLHGVELEAPPDMRRQGARGVHKSLFCEKTRKIRLVATISSEQQSAEPALARQYF